MKKVCTLCDYEKLLEDFSPNKHMSDGRQPRCKKCCAKIKSEYREKNKEKVQEQVRNSWHKNKEKYNNDRRNWPEWKKEKRRKWERKNRLNNLQSERAKEREYIKRKRKDDNYVKQYRDYHNKYEKDRRNRDINFKLIGNLRGRISEMIRGKYKAGKSLDLLGCSIEKLKNHLQSQFTPEMTWGNYATYWHVDHIKACCLFDLTIEENQYKCFNYKNLRPLEGSKNISLGQEAKKLAKQLRETAKTQENSVLS